MSPQKPAEITAFEQTQLANLTTILDEMQRTSLRVRYEDKIPTVNTLQENELVIFDDGVTKTLYTITGKGNLGSVTLT